MENKKDNTDFEHNERMAEISKKYEKKKKIRPIRDIWKFIKRLGL